MIFSLLIGSSACRRGEQKAVVPALPVALKIRTETGLNEIFSLTGFFDYSSENLSFTGNFWLVKDTTLRVKVFGPLGLGRQEFTIRDFGHDILNFIFGFADTLTGLLIVRDNTFTSPDGSFSFTTGKDARVLYVSTDEYKIYLMDYKKRRRLNIPHKIRVVYRDGVINIRIKQVELPS